MKKSELKRIIKNELLKEGFEGFNGVIGLGSTNKMTSLSEMDAMYGGESDLLTYLNDYDTSKLGDPYNKGIKADVVIDDEKDGSKTKRTIWIESEKDVREDLNSIMSDTQAIDSLKISMTEGEANGEYDFGDVTPGANDQDIAEILQDALDKIEDAGVSIADEGRSIQDIFNKLIIGLSRESDI
jgi:hypothetical protein